MKELHENIGHKPENPEAGKSSDLENSNRFILKRERLFVVKPLNHSKLKQLFQAIFGV
ncbi:MAG: hypothetical protein IT569_03995 [Leptospiraceae bacterium]|nr:hypothetical protein [Leptospiraceae bacterium]